MSIGRTPGLTGLKQPGERIAMSDHDSLAVSGTVGADVRRALKLWAYIESLADNGVDIRCAGNLWMIGDHWNETTEATGNGLAAAVDALPDRTANAPRQGRSEATYPGRGCSGSDSTMKGA